MQTKLSILALVGLLSSAYGSPTSEAAITKLTYYKDHTCGSANPLVADLRQTNKCYNLAFPSKSFNAENFAKGCLISAYKEPNCKHNDNFQLIGGASDTFCYESDGRPGHPDIVQSVILTCKH